MQAASTVDIEERRFWEATFERLDDYFAAILKGTITREQQHHRADDVIRSTRSTLHPSALGLTDPQILREFMCVSGNARVDAATDVRVGGSFRIVMFRDDGEQFIATGTYRELAPNERIVCTWSWEEDDPALARETILTLEFAPRGTQTELTLTHENFRDAQQRDNHARLGSDARGTGNAAVMDVGTASSVSMMAAMMLPGAAPPYGGAFAPAIAFTACRFPWIVSRRMDGCRLCRQCAVAVA